MRKMAKLLASTASTVLVAFLAISNSSQAATLVATQANINTVLAAAAPGDHVTVPVGSGVFGVGVWNALLKIAPGVVLDLKGSPIASVYAQNVNGLNIQNGNLPGSGDWHGCIYVTAQGPFTSVNIAVANNYCKAGGITVRDSNAVVVQTNINIDGAIYIGGVKGFVVVGNQTWGANADGIDLAGVSYGKIYYNILSGSLTQNVAHPDHVQGEGAFGPYPRVSDHLEIYQNVEAGASQGYDFWNGGDYIYLHDNLGMNNYSWGGALSGTTHSVMANMRVITLPGAPWPSSLDTRGSLDVVSCGNNIAAYTPPGATKGWAANVQPSCTAAQLAKAAADQIPPPGIVIPPLAAVTPSQ